MIKIKRRGNKKKEKERKKKEERRRRWRKRKQKQWTKLKSIGPKKLDIREPTWPIQLNVRETESTALTHVLACTAVVLPTPVFWRERQREKENKKNGGH